MNKSIFTSVGILGFIVLISVSCNSNSGESNLPLLTIRQSGDGYYGAPLILVSESGKLQVGEDENNLKSRQQLNSSMVKSIRKIIEQRDKDDSDWSMDSEFPNVPTYGFYLEDFKKVHPIEILELIRLAINDPGFMDFEPVE